jgi:hypothetical protein
MRARALVVVLGLALYCTCSDTGTQQNRLVAVGGQPAAGSGQGGDAGEPHGGHGGAEAGSGGAFGGGGHAGQGGQPGGSGGEQGGAGGMSGTGGQGGIGGAPGGSGGAGGAGGQGGSGPPAYCDTPSPIVLDCTGDCGGPGDPLCASVCQGGCPWGQCAYTLQAQDGYGSIVLGPIAAHQDCAGCGNTIWSWTLRLSNQGNTRYGYWWTPAPGLRACSGLPPQASVPASAVCGYGPCGTCKVFAIAPGETLLYTVIAEQPVAGAYVWWTMSSNPAVPECPPSWL